MTRWTFWIPLGLFAAFCGLAAYQLTQPKDEFIASTMIGKPVPDFALRPAHDERPGLTIANLRDGKPKLLNIWASWCVPCIAEAPYLEALRAQGAEVVGVAIRDRPADVSRFLATYGNPYSRIGADDLSEVQLSIGSSGVPETFVVDGNGIITYQHIGDVRAEHVPMLLQALAEAGQ
ncbi:DsbE family thiol:disulfide interchange protein [Pontixanthobacter gangjinensis]|uniref:DsbE family thiol:disulfide interchange protein n=1 Tax=Pontixanthobacter gangjinensis TaxID=1028742 RepID=A0A6I4SNV8_9SPHN|nr:DsbE family thiol:disulfide interchange protein [Pontixanthobacter gangjinensis]MXO57329.1 DsbE family thiol:disulfide interchange protein [Pontixanthobacter gangjinensis]